jgi:TonB family protein
MQDAASQAIAARAHAAGGVAAWLGVSLAGHALLVVVALAVPRGWMGPVEEPRAVMTISLGGASGPRAGGMSTIGGQAVQRAVPPTPEKRPEPPRPPAAKPPAMTMPAPSRLPARPVTPPKTAAPETTGRTPTTGPVERPGSALAQTGGRGIGFGLSTGGGGTGGEFDVGDFCCPDYLSTMIDLIDRNWNSKQQVAGSCVLRFTVRRDGTMAGAQVILSSGFSVLDLAAQRAVLQTRLPPLPAAYPYPQLTINLTFTYQR